MYNNYSPDLQHLKELMNKFASDENIKGVLLLMAGKNYPPKTELETELLKFPKPLIGGIFPELIVQGKRVLEGSLMIPLYSDFQTAIIPLNKDVSDQKQMLYQSLSLEYDKENCLFVFVDALSGNKNQFIHNLYNFYGATVKYLGGGAGSLSFNQFPCVLHNSGVFENAAVVGLLKEKVSIGVAHGWTSISEPLRITSAEGNKIITINWKPAFEVYRTWVENHSGIKFNGENFFDLAKSYPLGMVKLDTEMVIRDPFAVDNGSCMLIVDEVPEGEYVNIMHGDMESLLKGAYSARVQSEKNGSDNDLQTLCIDCISRVLYMQDDFDREINILSGSGKADGILTIGEIANSGSSFLEMFNKTTVVAKWKKKT
jgi:hypothetical protein